MQKIVSGISLPILGAIVSLLATNTFNIFNYFPFVPDEYRYEICLTVYLAVFDFLIRIVYDLLVKILIKKFHSEIQVIFCLPNTESDIGINPTVVFNEEGQSQIDIRLKVSGQKKHFHGKRIQISQIACADFQVNIKNEITEVEGNNFYINLEKLFANSNENDLESTHRLVLIQTLDEIKYIANIKAEFLGKPFNIKFKSNFAKVKVGER